MLNIRNTKYPKLHIYLSTTYKQTSSFGETFYPNCPFKMSHGIHLQKYFWVYPTKVDVDTKGIKGTMALWWLHTNTYIIDSWWC